MLDFPLHHHLLLLDEDYNFVGSMEKCGTFYHCALVSLSEDVAGFPSWISWITLLLLFDEDCGLVKAW